MRRPHAAALGAAGLVLLLAGCGAESVSVTPPQPGPSAAAACDALDAALPDEVDGSAASETSPESPYTAAWGGEILLTCGGGAPKVPVDAQLFTIEDVDWYPEELPQGGTRFSTVGRVATVAVTVPATRTPEANAVVDLSPAVRAAVPTAK